MPWIPTNEIVQNQIESFKNYADQSYAVAMDALRQVADQFDSGLGATKIKWSGAHANPAGLPDFERPFPAPETPDMSITIPPAIRAPLTGEEIRAALEDVRARLRALAIPSFADEKLPIQFPSRPETALPALPDDPAPFVPPSYPSAPTWDEPVLPDLRTVQLPELLSPDLAKIESILDGIFRARPMAPAQTEIPDFGAQVAHYASLTDNQLTAFIARCPALAAIGPRLGEWLSGHSIGIPGSVARSLRDRAFAAEDLQAVQAEQAALGGWLARGFTLPSGVLEANLAQIRQLNRDKKSQINRDLWLEEARLEIENLRFAIGQGIAYEGQLRDSWLRWMDLARQLATGAIDAPLRMMESAVALFRAAIDGWQAEFAASEQMLRMEMAKLEQFSKELEAQRLISELNQQDIALYSQQWSAVGTRVEVFGKLIDAASGMLQGELGKLEWSAKRMAHHASQLGAIETEWKIYSEAARVESLKNDIRKTNADIFSARVNAYAQQASAEKVISDIDAAAIKLQLEAWQSLAQNRRDEIQAEIARIEAIGKAAATESEVFRTLLQSETAFVDYEIKKLDSITKVDSLNAEVAVKQAALDQDRVMKVAEIALAALDGIARTASQLSGSAMSAMNVHAGLSSSSSSSYSESHNYQYEG